MELHTVFFIMLLMIAVKSDDFQLRYVNETVIKDQNYCDNRICILKCCPASYFLVSAVCKKPKGKKFQNIIKFSKTKYLNEITNSLRKKSEEIFFVYNDASFNQTVRNLSIQGLENGILYKSDGEMVSKFKFCVDYIYAKIHMSNGTVMGTAKFVFRRIPDRDDYDFIKQLIITMGMLTSFVFLLFLLLVYKLVPDILNRFNGKLLMSYVVVLIIWFGLKALSNILVMKAWIDMFGCSILSPVIYFFTLSNFFWLLSLSHDLWQLIRKPLPRVSLNMSRNLTRSEKKKVCRYYTVSYGLPGIITTFVVIVYLTGWHHEGRAPPFASCMFGNASFDLYVYVPIGIIMFINGILFFMCIYQLWIVQRSVNAVDPTFRRRKRRFYTHLKLFVLMGLNWVLELIPDDSLGLFIFTSIYNLSIGIIIYLIITWKQKIYKRLYEKYVLKNKGNKPNPQSFKSNTSYRVEQDTPVIIDKTRATMKRESEDDEKIPMQTVV